MIRELICAAFLSMASATAPTQPHAIVGDWTMQLPGAVRMENGEQTITYVKGTLNVVAQGDSLIATLATEPVEGRPARPPARMAVATSAAGGTVTFTPRSEATLNMNGEEVKRTSISTYAFTVTGDALKGTITRSIEGLDIPMNPVDITGTRVKK
ncbi:MAG: hypothetical protein IT353_20300 [Gemmatimonadaceae bacterium]|nr:hypothetical protein [Gemmatimonadaceae bacterium]